MDNEPNIGPVPIQHAESVLFVINQLRDPALTNRSYDYQVATEKIKRSGLANKIVRQFGSNWKPIKNRTDGFFVITVPGLRALRAAQNSGDDND